MCTINDPVGQSHSPACGDHYSQWKVVLLCDILKSVDGCTDGRKDSMCENSNHDWPSGSILFTSMTFPYLPALVMIISVPSR